MIPKLRKDRQLDPVGAIITTYVTGMSTRKVDVLVKALGCCSRVWKSTVLRSCHEIDREVAPAVTAMSFATSFFSFPRAPPAGVGTLAAMARPSGAQRTGHLPAGRHDHARGAPGRSPREAPTSALSECSRRSRFASLKRRVPQSQEPLDLPSELPIDSEATLLGRARTPACRTFRKDRPEAAATIGVGTSHATLETGRPRPLATPVRLRPDAIASTLSSRSSNDRRAPGKNTLQLADH